MDDVVGAVNSGKVNDLHAKHRLATQQQISPAGGQIDFRESCSWVQSV